MTMTSDYSRDFFRYIATGKDAYKNILVPIMSAVQPNSVVDLGAGSGTWLAAAKDMGASRVLGVDGPWASTEHQHLSADEFMTVDLEGDLPDVGRFDLAICLEVLEHISEPAGERAVRWLCDRSDVILFSAAIPGQGGLNHINEAWQSHWARKFHAAGFHAYDIVRGPNWRNGDIPFWYRQNSVVYAKPRVAATHGWAEADLDAIDIVHPDKFAMATETIARMRRRELKNRLRTLFGRPPKSY